MPLRWKPRPIDPRGRGLHFVRSIKVSPDTYVKCRTTSSKNIALEFTRNTDINELVPKSDIDPHYLIRPTFSCPMASRPRRPRRDPRNPPQHEHGRHRMRHADEPRAHHCGRSIRAYWERCCAILTWCARGRTMRARARVPKRNAVSYRGQAGRGQEGHENRTIDGRAEGWIRGN